MLSFVHKLLLKQKLKVRDSNSKSYVSTVIINIVNFSINLNLNLFFLL